METDINLAATHLGEDLIEKILNHEPTEVISAILKTGAPVWYQNATEGISPLHAATFTQNVDIVNLLLENGAVWNAVDHRKITAGDIALSFNNREIYTLIRNAGIRSELLLGVLEKRPPTDLTTLILRITDDTASGSSDAFLNSKLKYTTDEHGQQICLIEVDSDQIGVMMGWEEGIMHETVKKLCGYHPKSPSLKVLNIGFGLGLIDGLFQRLPKPPIEHVIIEAHPDVLKFMRDNGWHEKDGVRILEGRWQDFVDTPELLNSGGFDVIYTDTFSEDYSDLRQFFEQLPNLLADGDSRFSFFNGLGATNAFFYDIYTHISELHLVSVGLEVEWSDVNIAPDDDRWGRSREYFSLPIYRLPLGRMKLI